uniref:Uncharacterized protein n=1 Tax=Mus spicilegus TaxID=10103 RepID=A0A8C6HLR5_MUSSI
MGLTKNLEQLLLLLGKNLGSLYKKTQDLEATSEHFKKHHRRWPQSSGERNVKMNTLLCAPVHSPLHLSLCHWQHAKGGRSPLSHLTLQG